MALNELFDRYKCINLLLQWFARYRELHAVLEDSFNISVITKIEFLGWHKFAEDSALYEKAKSFINYARVVELDDLIVEKTIVLRQKFKVKTPDAIIAATSLVHNLGIITKNVDGFKKLKENT